MHGLILYVYCMSSTTEARNQSDIFALKLQREFRSSKQDAASKTNILDILTGG